MNFYMMTTHAIPRHLLQVAIETTRDSVRMPLTCSYGRLEMQPLKTIRLPREAIPRPDLESTHESPLTLVIVLLVRIIT